MTWLSLSVALSLAACSQNGGSKTDSTIIRFNEKFPGRYKIIPEDDEHEIELRVAGKHGYTEHGLYINYYKSTWDSRRAFMGRQCTLTISFRPTVIDKIIITGYDHTLYVSQVIDGGSIIIDSLDEPLPLSPKRKNQDFRTVVNLKKFYPGWLKKRRRNATSIKLVARGYDEYRLEDIEIQWMEQQLP